MNTLGGSQQNLGTYLEVLSIGITGLQTSFAVGSHAKSCELGILSRRKTGSWQWYGRCRVLVALHLLPCHVSIWS